MRNSTIELCNSIRLRRHPSRTSSNKKNIPDETVRDVDRDPETLLLENLFRAGSNKNVLVRMKGLELHARKHMLLRHACLPIPPHPQVVFIIAPIRFFTNFPHQRLCYNEYIYEGENN